MRDGEYVYGADLMRALSAFKAQPQVNQNGGRRNAGEAVTNGRWDYAGPQPDHVTDSANVMTPQARLAEKTGLNSQMISRYVNGKAGEWIALDRADLVLTAAGLQHHFLIDVPVYTWVNGVNITTNGESATMASEQSSGAGLYWCSHCQEVRNEGEVVLYVDLGRMDLRCRSGKVQPLERAVQLGLVPPSE